LPGWWLDPEPTHEFRSEVEDADSVLLIASGTLWREVDLDWNTDPAETDAENVLVFAEFKNDKDK
jgi:hypothetical protein